MTMKPEIVKPYAIVHIVYLSTSKSWFGLLRGFIRLTLLLALGRRVMVL